MREMVSVRMVEGDGEVMVRVRMVRARKVRARMVEGESDGEGEDGGG